MTTEAQRKASRKWNTKNQSKSNFYSMRSTAKRFIKNFASQKDIEDLKILLDERETQLKEENIQ